MQYAEIPYVGQKVSRIVLGGSGKLFTSGADVSEVMEAALSAGINCVDTARAYGGSESAVGRYLRESGRRNELVLISKCCHPAFAFVPRVNQRSAREDLLRSLEELGTDHIDIYFLHRDNEFVGVERVAEFMTQMHEEGKIGAFGGSNWRTERIRQLNAYAESHGLNGFTVTSPHYSLGVQIRDPWGNGCRSITGDKNAAQREWLAQKGLGVFCWSSLCGGMFSGKLKSDAPGELHRMFGFNTAWGYSSRDNFERLHRCEILAKEKGAAVSQIVLSWILGSEMKTFAIAAGSSPERVRQNAQAADLVLTGKERAWLNLKSEEC